MLRRLAVLLSTFRIILLQCIIFIITNGAVTAQNSYTMNYPGSVCYIKYIRFAPDGDYSSSRRPNIFILGQENQTAQQLFDTDTLKNSPKYHNFQFNYIPNNGISIEKKLGCIESLVSIITNRFEYGRGNLFLQINDPGVKQSDIVLYDLKSVFTAVRYPFPAQQNQTKSDISIVFKEDVLAYGPEIKLKNDGGSYYIEKDKEQYSTENEQIEKPKKTYFGAPKVLNFTMTGIIRDKTNGEALPGASIYIKGTTIGASTNTDGYFTIIKIPTDTSTIIVQYLGYEKTEVFLTPETKKTNLLIEITQQSQTLNNVIVTGYRDDIVFVKKAEVSTVKLTPKKLEMLPSLGERDIMRSFQLMPGVSASNESSSGLYVRGGTPDQNLVLYDGFTVYHVDHLYGFYSAFNSNALKDVQLYKGGFESKFGGRISSVTEITSKEGNQKNFNVGGDLSLLSINLYAEMPVGKKFSSIIAFRRSYKGALYNSIFDKFNKTHEVSAPQRTMPGPMGGGGRFSQNSQVTSYFYDLNGKFTYRAGEKDIISLSIFNGTDKLDNSIASDIGEFGPSGSSFSMSSTDLTKYGNVGSSLKWSRKWNSKLYGNTILSYSNFYSNRDRTQDGTMIDSNNVSQVNKTGILENNNLKDYSFKSDYNWDIINNIQVQFGVFVTNYNIKYTYAQSDTTTILNRTGQSLLSGFYLQNQLKFFKDKLLIKPGIRISSYEITNKIYYEPRANISYNLTKKLTLKGATGKYYQFANRVTREDILSGSKDFWILADGNSIPVSSSIHYIAGISYEADNYTFSVEGYYKKIQNLTEYSLRIRPSPMGVNYDESFFTGNGYSKGIEFLAQKNSGKFNGWVSYTLGEARNHFDVYSDTYFPANQDVTHEFKIVGLYKYRRWDFSANWIFATGRPYTAPSGAYSINLLDGTTQDYFTVTSKNSVRLPDYHRLDISANYKLLLGYRGDKIRREIGYISFSLFNVYNRKNIWYKQYTIESGNLIETNVTYLGLTPNITISFKLR
jgi:ferric enterobactin receptor